ncbi:hypothetical protein [Lysinibacillus fusiformis]|uniref:hypothetical protein n=1 Tax=Lysinibacillus fusiformis TaxID=28031 RepID=UPI003D02154D
MFNHEEKLVADSHFAEDSSLQELQTKLLAGRTTRPILTKEQVVEHQKRLNELEATDLGKKVLNEWKIEGHFGYSSVRKENTEAIKLTNKISGESMAFLKSDIQDTQRTEYIVRLLSALGEIERSYIRFFLNYLNAVRGIPRMMTEVKDLTLVVSELSLKVGQSVLRYYRYFLEDYRENYDKYPTKSSNQYKKNVSRGVILDNDSIEFPKNEHGFYPVAIRTGKLREIFPYMDNKEYGEVIRRLAYLGVFHESVCTRVFEGKSTFKTKFKMIAGRLEKKGDKNYHDSVYIFNIIPSLLEVGNQHGEE